MHDLAMQPMGLYGALAALVVFGIFLGTWWFYGMRTHGARRMLDTGAAILVDVDPREVFAAARIDGARNIPLEELDENAWQLGSKRRTIVLCGSGVVRGLRAASRLRDFGYRVINVGSAFAPYHG